jgi:hypothetical protein
MADTAPEVLAGIVARLQGFPGLASVADSIFSAVPQGTPFPYVEVNIMSLPFAANDFSGQQHTVRVQAHSQSGSKKEALDIRQQVMAALDREEENITVEGTNLVMCQFSGFADCFIEDDGKTWQSVIEFDLRTM